MKMKISQEIKFDDIKIGDKVRCYYFINVDDHFVEGEVVDIGKVYEYPGCERYHIRVERSVWYGKDEKVKEGEMYYAPVNGTTNLFRGVCKI